MAEDPAEVVAAVNSLFRAIERFSLPDIQSRYLHEPRLFVFLEGPESKVEGWDQERSERSWRALLERATFHEIRLDSDMRAGRSGDLGWVGGTIHLAYSPVGVAEPTDRISNRGTWILERQGGEWVIVFEHVSFAIPEPYPTA
jgi:hypothetical protein